MEIRSECRACLERLVELTVGLATQDPAVRARSRAAARRMVAGEFGPEAIPAVIATHFLHAIHQISGNYDPFASRKVAATAHLARMYQRLEPEYPEDLPSLLHLAARGNAVDFFREEAEVAQDILTQAPWGILDLPRFLQELASPPGLLLYLADNAGEQFFDRPLVAYLRRRGWEVLYVVKGAPIQNDLTRQDLYASGLGPVLEPVADTGAATVGLSLEETGETFRALYRRARLILAKGMGHFETLSFLPDPRLFFLLQAKCTPVAQALGVSRRAFVFCRSPAISLDGTRANR
jgi:uncharacterized protein with ATP-grasp and redox domains